MCCIIAHRSPPVDQQNSASTVETDQPEDPAVGTKRATMMSACSKIVLPSSNAEEYSTIIIRGIISRIVNPKGTCVSLIVVELKDERFYRLG